MKTLRSSRAASLCALSLLMAGCVSGVITPLSGEDGGVGGAGEPPGTGGAPGTGGMRGTGGTRGTGGVVLAGTGGRGTGGALGSGGARDAGLRDAVDARDTGADVRVDARVDARADTGTTADGGTATFTDVYNMLITPFCAGAACHNPGAQQGFSFSTKMAAYTSFRNNAQPGNAAASNIYMILANHQMPPPGRPAPSAQVLAVLAAWINAGALNN
jgi:hypothetical protein